MEKECLKCGEKKRMFSKNYSGLHAHKATEHSYPERIEELTLPGDPINNYLCEKCANEYKTRCKKHGLIVSGVFKSGKPPICGKCYQEKQDATKEENALTKEENALKKEGIINKFLPKIKQLVTEKLGPAARGAAANEKTMEFVVSKIYKFLPLPIRLAMNEKMLFDFCWKHKEKIFSQTRVDSNRSINDEKNDIQLTENEENYLKSIKFMLEDDNLIDAGERRMLERKRQNLEISEERSKFIENLILKNSIEFSSDEAEYFSEVKIYLNGDAQIPEDERKVLDNLAGKLNISKERANEIEKIAFSDQD